MLSHIVTSLAASSRRQSRVVLCLSVILLLILVQGSEAIVKQQQQQQQRSDDSQQQANNGAQSYNHQQQLSAAAAASSASSSSSASLAASSAPSSSISVQQQSSQSPYSSPGQASAQVNSPQASSQVSPSQAANQQQQQQQSNGRDYANYANSNGNSNMAAPKTYMDSLSASASNNEQSYQAAANSVNLALANSGIFGSNSNSYGSSSGSAGQQQQLSNSPSSPQSLNPLHYFYYPSKEASSSSSNSQNKASAIGQQQQQGSDSLSNAASNTYQAMAAYPYSDQLGSALSSMGVAPEAAASSQDPSYVPQPSNVDHSMYGQQGQQQQASGAHQGYSGDLNMYSSNLSPVQNQPQQQQQANQQHNSQQQQQQPSSISFNGPTSSSQDNVRPPNSPDNSYVNSHMAANQQPMSAYQSNLFNQMNDLSTSNFGNNAGGLSSVASYMSPNQQAQHQNQHDLFASLGGQQLAASQLSPSATSAPSQHQNQNLASSIFGSSLFGQQAAAAAGQGQGGASAGSNLFANQQYLNSFLQPQQFGGQMGGQSDQQMVGAGSSPASSSTAAAASSSSKRFGISSFIMPMLALAGLSLLIPTMSNIGTAVGRKKRSIGEDRASVGNRQQQISFDSMNGASQLAKEHSIGEYMDKIERYYSIYKNAVESDDCMNRLICEFGDAVKDVTGKAAVVTVIEKLVPTWMTGKVHLFKDAALDNKEGKEKCKKYICHSNKQH